MNAGKFRIGKVVPIVLLASVLLFGMVYNAIISRQWAEYPEPPGHVIHVVGQDTYVTDIGKGAPAVIILHDVLSFSPEWWPIQEHLSEYTRVITYDRPGYGWSRGGRKPLHSLNIINDLKDLMDQLNVNGPCVIIGHGTGGLYAYHFAMKYPDRVSGIILVNPIAFLHTISQNDAPVAEYLNLIDRSSYLYVLRALSYTGIIRVMDLLPKPIHSEALKKILKNHYSLYRSYNAMIDEYVHNLKISVKMVNGTKLCQDIPVWIICPSLEKAMKTTMSFGLSYDKAKKIERIKMESAEKTAATSNNGEMLLSQKGSHSMHLEDPEIILKAVCGLILKDSEERMQQCGSFPAPGRVHHE